MKRLVLFGGIALLGLNLRIASASVPPVLADLGLSPGAAAALAAIPAVCFGIAAFSGTAVRARFGEELGLFLALAVLLAGLLARAMWVPWGLFPGTILAGASVAVMNVLMPILVRQRLPTHAGVVTATYLGALTVGSAAAAALTIPLKSLGGGSVSFALGIWAAPVAIAMIVWVPQLRTSTLVTLRGAARHQSPRLHTNRRAWEVTLFFGLQSLIFFAVFSWLPTIYRDRGVTAATAGLLFAVLVATGIVGNLVMPLVAARLRDQQAPVVAAAVLTAIGLLGIMAAPVATAVVWVSLLGIGGSGAFSLALLLVVLRSGDSNVAAGLSSMAQGVGYLISACGPIILATLHSLTGSWTVGLVVLIALTTIELTVGLRAGRIGVVG